MGRWRAPFDLRLAKKTRSKPELAPWLQRERHEHPGNLCSYDYWKRLYRATPWWICFHAEKMREVYRECPRGWNMDHEVPLRHPYVCGLNVPWNLKKVPRAENLIKSNHHWPDCPHEIEDMFGQSQQQLTLF